MNNNTVALATKNLGLKSIYLYDSYLPNAFTEMDLADGNTNLTGENGAGKTSTLNLIPIFYGARPDRLIDRSANKMSFVNYYLPNLRSMIVFEYCSPVGPCCVVLYRLPNQDKYCFRFIQGSAKKTIFSNENIEFHKEHSNFKALFEEMQKGGINTSRQIDNGLDYMAVLTNDKSRLNKDLKLRDLAITFSLCGKGYEMKHINALTQITLNKHNLLDSFKMMLVDAFLDNDEIINSRLNALETQSLISNIATLRQFENEMPKIQIGIEQRRALLDIYSKLNGDNQSAENRINSNLVQISQIGIDQNNFISKGRKKKEDLENAVQIAKSDLFAAKNKLNICQNELNKIEEQEISYGKPIFQQKCADYNNRAHFRQVALDAKHDFETMSNSNNQVSQHFDKLIKEELEKKEHRQKELNNQINVVSENIEALQSNQSKEIQKIKQEEQNQLTKFEATKEFERNQFDIQIDNCRNNIEISGKKTVEEQEKTNEFELNINSQKKKISAKEDEISISEKDTNSLQNDKARMSAELNAIARKLESAVKEENDIRKILFEKNTLLQFLNDKPNCDWKNNIAKVINPKLLLSKGLNPSWSADQQPGQSSFYGLELDLSKIEIPREAESADELIVQLKECEANVQSIKSQQNELNKQFKNLDDAIRGSEQKTLKLKSELRQLKENLQSTESMFTKFNKQVATDTEQRIKGHKRELSVIQEQLKIFKQKITTERQMVYQRFDAERQNIIKRFEHLLSNKRQEKQTLFNQAENLEVKFNEKKQALISLRNSELQKLGIDIEVLKTLENRANEAGKKFRVIEGYATEIDDYERWKKNDFERKGSLITTISNAQEESYKLEDQLSKLSQENKVYGEYFRSEHKKFEDAKKELNHQNEVIRTLCKRIENTLDGIPGIDTIQSQENLTTDALIRMIEDDLHEQARLEKELRQSLRNIVFILQKNTDFELYRRWQERMDSLGAISEAARGLYSMQEIEKLVYQEMTIQTGLVVNNFNLNAIILKNYAQALNSFKRKLNSTSKKLTEQTNSTNPFPALGDIQINLLSILDTENNQGKKSVYEQIAQYLNDLENNQFADQGVTTLPSVEIVSSFEATLKAIKNLNVNTDDLYSLVKLNIHYKENNRAVFVKNDSDLVYGSSTGLSRLIVIIIFTALTRQLCPNKNVVIHVPLDEISQFDSQNTTRLFELMEKLNINLVCAQPNLSIELSKRFKHKHDVDRNFGIRKFKAAQSNTSNPLLK